MSGPSSELRAFDATARLGSMSAAARELGLTQPTVSAHIAAVERRYGVELFHRLGRRVDLTEFGELLHEITHRGFRAERDALALLREARESYAGRLHLCAVGPYNITPLIRRFRERWPAVQITVSIGDSRQIVSNVRDHRGDLGMPLHDVNDPAVHSRPWRRQRLMVFAPRRHRLAAQRSVELHELDGEEFVMREVGSTTRRVFEQGLAAASVRVRVALEMGSREAVREAVAQVLGLGVVADTAYVPDSRLAPLPIAGAGLHTHPHIICLRERMRARLIRNFLAVADELMPD